MRELIKKLIAIFLVLLMVSSPATAKDKVKMISNINHNFTLSNIPKEVQFKTIKKVTMPGDVVIPQRSLVTADTIRAQKELRWHKSGYILCKLKYYLTEYNQYIDISDKNIYIIARKWEPVNKKEASILATEILLTQAASFFAPGVDVLYFFTKGAIIRDKHPNWFKAGVHNAYENSICWFWLKGKPIELEKDAKVQLKTISEEKVEKLSYKIDKRNEKISIKDENRKMKQRAKHDKKDIKNCVAEMFEELNKQEPGLILAEIKTQTYEEISECCKEKIITTEPEGIQIEIESE